MQEGRNNEISAFGLLLWEPKPGSYTRGNEVLNDGRSR